MSSFRSVLKFDTRHKKPKLWNILIQFLAVAAILLAMILDDAHQHALLISALLEFFFLAVVVQLIVALIKQIQYNPYSYNTIFYTGFALFTLAVCILLLIICVRLIREPTTGADQILRTLLDSAKTYMQISFPFIVTFSVALFISNISLIRHEGKRLVNVLGIILSFLLIGGELFLFVIDYYASGSKY